MTLRNRLIAVSIVTLAIGLGALLVVGNVLLAVRTSNETDSLLKARADAQVAALDVTSTGVSVREVANDTTLDREAWVFSREGEIERPANVAPALERVARELGSAGITQTVDGPDDLRLRAQQIRARGTNEVKGTVVVGVSTEAVEAVRQEVLIGSLALAFLVLIAGAIVTRSAVDGALEHVAVMTESAESWGAHDLDKRFALGPARDELTGLAATLDKMLARIAASRRHEQRFADDVAHELRTPLAALRGHAELGLNGDAVAQQKALHDVLSASERLDETINALLKIARADIDPTAGSVDLAALAAAVENAEIIGAEHPARAEGDPDILRRALAPLVDNARRHAAEHVTLEIVRGEGTVSILVRDDGPGLSTDLTEAAFEPGVQGAGSDQAGAGLGLPLARRLARACGGDVIATPGPGGCFELRLPAV